MDDFIDLWVAIIETDQKSVSDGYKSAFEDIGQEGQECEE